ncbi:MAG: hypothetical protein Alpg2KO_28860 [Alphaproteobacteria bacterium]
MPSLKDIQMSKTDQTVVKDERIEEFRNWEEQAHLRYLKSVGKDKDSNRDDDDMVDILQRQGNVVNIPIRLLAWFIDMGLSHIPLIIGNVVGFYMLENDAERLREAASSLSGFQTAPWPLQIGTVLTYILVIVTYYILPPIRGGSFGQSVLGIQVVVMNNNRVIGFFRNFFRTTLFFTGPFLALGAVAWMAVRQIEQQGPEALFNPIWLILAIFAGDLPYAIALFNEKKRCMHDFLTGTRLRYRSAIG